jgi:ATP-dependent Clp protease protease subunit
MITSGSRREGLRRAARRHQAKTIHLRINSPGGDVFAARSMVTAIRGHQARKVIAHIDGLAASAASFVAIAAAEVVMTQGAMLMIHNAWSIAYGNKDDFLAMADLLEKIDESIVTDYERKTKKSRADLEAMDAGRVLVLRGRGEGGRLCRPYRRERRGEPLESLAYENAPEPASNRIPRPRSMRAHFERRFELLEKCPA